MDHVDILCHVAWLDAFETVMIAVFGQEEEAAELYRPMAVDFALAWVAAV